jgi:Tol biopolymer transport system component/DNA-binding winged helix-turn-helix (wHTH) protein
VFEVDLANAELRKGGLRLRVQEQPFQVLAALLEQPGELISREALIARLWPDGTVVDFDRGLNAAITRLRQTLSDSAETPRYIETVARRGYRFIGPLGTMGDPANTSVGELVPTPSRAEPASTIPKRRFWVWPALALLFIGSVVISLWVFRTREVAGRPLSAIPVTSEPGSELCPSFAPDGTRIAYEWDEGHGDSHIFIKLVGAGDPIRLTSEAAHEFGPAWSPDGSQIAFVRRLDEGRLGVILKPAIGGVERPLTEFATPVDWWPQEPGYRWLAWTPDGKHLIVSGAQDASAPLALYVVSVEGADRRRLTTPPDAQTWDRSPAVSPMGRTVAFSRRVSFGDSALYLLTLSDDLRPIGDPRRVTSANRGVQSLAWTADGREIVFSGNGGLWRIELGANGTSRQPAWVGEGGSPAVAKGGRLIYTRSFAESNIWRQELLRDGGTVPPASPLISSTAVDTNPQYSPDGKQIAFQSRRSGYAEIWLCGSDGAQCGPLTSFHGSPAGTPRWSPDGKRIAFDCQTAGNWDVWVMDANGGSRRRLTSDPATDSIPSWSRDGKWIYFASNRKGRFDVWKVPSEGGAQVPVTKDGGFAAFESYGGDALYYTKGDLGLQLWRSALDGSGETKIIDAIAARGFVVGEDHIYYLRPEPGGRAALWRHILSTGKASLVSSPLKRLVLGLSVSPDEKYAIYSQVDHEGSDLMLVENFH